MAIRQVRINENNEKVLSEPLNEASITVPIANKYVRGIGRSATDAETQAGITGENGPAWVTPEQLRKYGDVYITETYRSEDGKSGYRKWSDGFVEQWFDFLSRQNYITFFIPFANTNYIVSKLLYSTASTAVSGGGLSVNSMTTTSLRDGSDGNAHVALMVWGFAAE